MCGKFCDLRIWLMLLAHRTHFGRSNSFLLFFLFTLRMKRVRWAHSVAYYSLKWVYHQHWVFDLIKKSIFHVQVYTIKICNWISFSISRIQCSVLRFDDKFSQPNNGATSILKKDTYIFILSLPSPVWACHHMVWKINVTQHFMVSYAILHLT